VVEIERRGDIWVARLNPNRDGEIGKVRPVVVIQSDALSAAGLATVLVVPLTTQHRPGSEALRVHISARGRLLRDCWAMAEQVRALDRSRFGDGPLATLTADELAALERALQAALGMW
jgi:mRNA interferase MazF